MVWLLIVSFVWAFSFGLIKGRLAGIDPSLVAFVRLALSLLVFLPFLRPRGLRRVDYLVLPAIGAIQFGVMYIAYTAAYGHLQAHEVALWTIFTPLFVCMIEDLWARRLRLWPLAAAGLATIGAGIVSPPRGDALIGIALVQVSNLCFAAGQIAYRRWRQTTPTPPDFRVFALLYVGAVIATLPTAVPTLGGMALLDASQWMTLAYLGIIASGVCFFLWNLGAARTSPGLLAVVNDAKIPLAVLCSLLFFREKADAVSLALGGGLVVLAGLLAKWAPRGRNKSED